MARLPLKMLTAVAALTATACGTTPDAPSEPAVADATELTVHDSCGTSFTVRDTAGTTRLSISIGIDSLTAAEPGIYELGAGEQGDGLLELGSGLDVWPCHDVATDFESERVQENWTVTSGAIELLDPVVPDDSGGGGSSAVRAVLLRAEIVTGDNTVIVLEDVEMLNPRWGFFGG